MTNQDNKQASNGCAISTPSLVAMHTINLQSVRGTREKWRTGRGGDEDRARGIDVRGSRNSMNRYRLAAHFASRSCDGLVKRFGLSSPTFPASSSSYINTNTSAPIPHSALLFFFHCTPPRGGSKANQRGSRSRGIFETKDESRGCMPVRVFHEMEKGDEGGERSNEKFYRVFRFSFSLVASSSSTIAEQSWQRTPENINETFARLSWILSNNEYAETRSWLTSKKKISLYQSLVFLYIYVLFLLYLYVWTWREKYFVQYAITIIFQLKN